MIHSIWDKGTNATGFLPKWDGSAVFAKAASRVHKSLLSSHTPPCSCCLRSRFEYFGCCYQLYCHLSCHSLPCLLCKSFCGATVILLTPNNFCFLLVVSRKSNPAISGWPFRSTLPCYEHIRNIRCLSGNGHRGWQPAAKASFVQSPAVRRLSRTNRSRRDPGCQLYVPIVSNSSIAIYTIESATRAGARHQFD